jgi:hypothetical protein
MKFTTNPNMHIQIKVWRQNQFFVTPTKHQYVLLKSCWRNTIDDFARCFKLQLRVVKNHATIILLEKRLLMFVNVGFNMKSCSDDVIKISGNPLICMVACHRQISDFLAQHH